MIIRIRLSKWKEKRKDKKMSLSLNPNRAVFSCLRCHEEQLSVWEYYNGDHLSIVYEQNEQTQVVWDNEPVFSCILLFSLPFTPSVASRGIEPHIYLRCPVHIKNSNVPLVTVLKMTSTRKKLYLLS